jgi:sortase A
MLKAPIPPQDIPVGPSTSPAPAGSSATKPLTYSEEVAATQAPELTQSPEVTESPEPSYLAGFFEGQKIGTITLPTLKLSWPIYEGTEEAELSKGVGHFSQSVLPGLSDNSVLAGHRSTVFNRLGELEIGDEIYIKTVAGTFIYEVENFKVVKRTDKSVIVPNDDATLTLTTCFPFNHIGVTTDAFIVTATLMQ